MKEDAETPPARLWNRNFVTLCGVQLLMTMAFYATMPIVALFAERRIGLSGTPLGLIIISATVAAIIARLLAGYLLDRYGRPVVFWSAFALFSGLYFLYPLANDAFTAGLLRFGHGLAWGAGMTAGTTVAVDVSPPARKGEAIGNYTVFMMVAMAVGPAIGMALLGSRGFDVLFLCAGIGGLAGLLLTTRLRFPAVQLQKRPFLLENIFERNALRLGVVVLLISMPYGFFMNYGAMYSDNVLHAPAGVFYALFAAGTALSRLFSGRVYDRHGPRLIFALALLMMLAGIIIMGITRNHLLFFAATFGVGLADGMGLPVVLAMVNNLVPEHRRGEANGTLMTFFEIGICGGVVVVSALYKSTGWPAAFGALALAIVLAALVWKLMALPDYLARRTTVQEMNE